LEFLAKKKILLPIYFVQDSTPWVLKKVVFLKTHGVRSRKKYIDKKEFVFDQKFQIFS